MKQSRNKLHTLAGQGTMSIVNKETFSSMKISVPSIKEQKIIGDFFSTLDCRIKFQKNYLNELINQKQAFMQQMFI